MDEGLLILSKYAPVVMFIFSVENWDSCTVYASRERVTFSPWKMTSPPNVNLKSNPNVKKLSGMMSNHSPRQLHLAYLLDA